MPASFNHFIALARGFTGILAPAGVAILSEMLRFERGVRIAYLSKERLGARLLENLTEDVALLRVEWVRSTVLVAACV